MPLSVTSLRMWVSFSILHRKPLECKCTFRSDCFCSRSTGSSQAFCRLQNNAKPIILTLSIDCFIIGISYQISLCLPTLLCPAPKWHLGHVGRGVPEARDSHRRDLPGQTEHHLCWTSALWESPQQEFKVPHWPQPAPQLLPHPTLCWQGTEHKMLIEQ